MSILRKIIGAVWVRALGVLITGVSVACLAFAQISPSSQSTVRLEAEQQRKEGDVFFADGKVEIEYKNLKLSADHVQYNDKSYTAAAQGNVRLDVETQHLIADSAEFNVRSGEGRFEHV